MVKNRPLFNMVDSIVSAIDNDLTIVAVKKWKNENEPIKKSNNYNNPLPFLGNKNVWNTAYSRSRGGSKKSKKSRKPVKKQRKTRRHKK